LGDDVIHRSDATKTGWALTRRPPVYQSEIASFLRRMGGWRQSIDLFYPGLIASPLCRIGTR
jgi:hypothetical protein